MAFALRGAVPSALLRPVAGSLRPIRAACTNLQRPSGKLVSTSQTLHRTPRSFTINRARSGATVMAAVAAETFYDFKVKDIDGRDVDLSKYRGKVVLVVNVASQCGFTPQYKELAELYNKYKGQGLVIIGFPCNQFGAQEPGSNAEIKRFAGARGANFPMMEKVDVNGSKAAPVYNFLKSKQGGFIVPEIKWNFTKFLLDKEGNVVKRYGSTTTPGSIEDDIKSLL